MADRLTPGPRFQIHQALYGYTEGHRQIASSLSLPAADAKLALVLSDSSGSEDDHGYLTGFPLPESGHYALARTWQAREMPRPGCVWTHVLFINFTDLANLPSVGFLLSLFRRPVRDLGFSEYAARLSVERPVADPLFVGVEEKNWCRQLLTALYEHPTEQIIAPLPDFNPEPFVLAVWFQQWPRLRRAFCFCTATTVDRSFDRLQFDLQILATQERGIPARFQNVTHLGACPPSGALWLSVAIDDLFLDRNTALREFLLRTGGDINTGRAAFSSLVWLHQLLEDVEASTIDAALSWASENLPSSSTAWRKMVVNNATQHIDGLAPAAMDFLADNLTLIDDELTASSGAQIGAALWRRSPAKFCTLLDGEGRGADIATLGLNVLSHDILIAGLPDATDHVERILECRPEIMKIPAFWRITAISRAAIAFLREKPGLIPDAVTAMIASGEPHLAGEAFSVFDRFLVWSALVQALDCVKGSNINDLEPWLRPAVAKGSDVAAILASGRIRKMKSLGIIARLTTPDFVPNEFGDDPWVLAVRAAGGKLAGNERTAFMAYLMVRALGFRSRSAGELAILAFDWLHQVLANDTMDEDIWHTLKERAYSSWFVMSWDRCAQLRASVTELFVSRELSPRLFPQLTTDEHLFGLLVDTLAATWRGRNYLKQVRHTLKTEFSPQFVTHLTVIEQALD